MCVEDPRYRNPLYKLFFQAAKDLGLSHNTDFNDWSHSQVGAAFPTCSCTSRQSALSVPFIYQVVYSTLQPVSYTTYLMHYFASDVLVHFLDFFSILIRFIIFLVFCEGDNLTLWCNVLFNPIDHWRVCQLLIKYQLLWAKQLPSLHSLTPRISAELSWQFPLNNCIKLDLRFKPNEIEFNWTILHAQENKAKALEIWRFWWWLAEDWWNTSDLQCHVCGRICMENE